MVSLNPLGAAFMSCFAGLFVDKLGRKGTMLLSNFLLAISCVMVAFALKVVHNKVADNHNGGEVYHRLHYGPVLELNAAIQ